MKIKPYILLCLAFLVPASFLKAQNPPFWNDIQAFKKQDTEKAPPKNAILFVGSSSFTNWKDVQDYFPGYPIINRGFGGSSLPDVIRYADDIIFPYHPKQIVIYCGENDLVVADSVTGEMVYRRFVELFRMIRKKIPQVPVIFISLKPSPSRWHLREKMITANTSIRSFLSKEKKTVFVDVYSKMLDKDGKPVQEIFREDNLHMNAKGYVIWQKELKPYLLK
jgi:lysophospholipase L1-like esterase